MSDLDVQGRTSLLDTPTVSGTKAQWIIPGLAFVAGFLLCLLVTGLVWRTSPVSPQTVARVAKDEPATKSKPLPTAASPTTESRRGAALHLIDAHGIDFGQLVPFASPAHTGNYNYPPSTFTVYDRKMDCFATYVGQMTSDPHTGFLFEARNLTLNKLRTLRRNWGPDASPGTFVHGVVLSFENDDCSGTPLVDMARVYSSNKGGSVPEEDLSRTDLLLDHCFAMEASMPQQSYFEGPQAVVLRAFKFVLPQKKIALSAVRTFCVFAPKAIHPAVVNPHSRPRTRVPKTLSDPHHLCSTCLPIDALSPNPTWAELVEVTPLLPPEMPTKPVRMTWN